MCGMPTFSTAEVPSAMVTLATQAQLTSGPSNGASSVSDHLCSSSCTIAGNRASQPMRSGILRQFSTSRSEMPNIGVIIESVVSLCITFAFVTREFNFEPTDLAIDEMDEVVRLAG